MRQFKKVLLPLLLLAVLLLLTGCKLTPEKVLKKMDNALSETPLSGFHAVMETGFSVDMDGIVTDTEMTIDADILFCREPLALYADMELTANGTTQSVQLYGLTENEIPVLYVCDSSNAELWTRTELQSDVLPAAPENTEQSQPDSSLFTLTEDATLSDGTVAHRLSCTVDATMAEDYEDAAAALASQLGLETVDLSRLSVPMDLFVDTKTFLPIEAELSVSGLEETIAPIISASLGVLGEGIEFSMEDIKLSLRDFRFGAQDVPPLPDEAPLRVELQTYDPDMGDGTYVIKTIYDAARVTCPDGWSVDASDYYYTGLLRDDGYRLIYFFTMEKSSPKDSGLYVFNDVVESCRAMGNYHSDSRGEISGDYELAWLRRSDGLFYVCGWKHLSDNTLLLIEVTDATGTYNAKSLISSAAEMVEPYTAP